MAIYLSGLSRGLRLNKVPIILRDRQLACPGIKDGQETHSTRDTKDGDLIFWQVPYLSRQSRQKQTLI